MAVFLLYCIISVLPYVTSGQRHEGIRGPFDICERDTFNATCPPGHMILIQDALYGRMTPGRCVQQSVTDGSCDTDVISIMDALCSGKEKCHVLGIQPELVYSKKCIDSAAYLRASYECIKVTSPIPVSCSNTTLVLNSESLESEGYLPLSILADHQVGGPRCPLVIPELNSKIFNLTLWSFHDNNQLSEDACFEVGMLGEKKGETPIVSCKGDPRRKRLFTSNGNEVSIHFHDVKGLQEIGTFILQYQASPLASSACPDPDLPSDASFTREDNQVSVLCDVTQQTWRLTCEEGRWTGELGECGIFEENNAGMSPVQANLAFSLGLLAVLSIGVAIVLFLGGFFFFVLCFSCKRIKRRSVKKSLKPDEVNFLYPYHTKLSHSDGSDPRSDYSRTSLYRPVTQDDSPDHPYMLYDRDYRLNTPAATPQVPRAEYMPLAQV